MNQPVPLHTLISGIAIHCIYSIKATSCHIQILASLRGYITHHKDRFSLEVVQLAHLPQIEFPTHQLDWSISLLNVIKWYFLFIFIQILIEHYVCKQ